MNLLEHATLKGWKPRGGGLEMDVLENSEYYLSFSVCRYDRPDKTGWFFGHKYKFIDEADPLLALERCEALIVKYVRDSTQQFLKALEAERAKGTT